MVEEAILRVGYRYRLLQCSWMNSDPIDGEVGTTKALPSARLQDSYSLPNWNVHKPLDCHVDKSVALGDEVQSFK